MFIQELRRYWPGYLAMDDGLERWQVSGAFPLNHINAVLELVADTLPLRIARHGRKRVRVCAA